MTATGEALHEIGADGAQAAKRWLESTTRAEVWWVRPNPVADQRLSFSGASNNTFSFDLGGLLSGGDTHGQEFLAEVKKYTSDGNQGTEFRKFLAKCYRAYTLRPERCGGLFWITWAPFNVTTWASLEEPDSVKDAIIEHWKYNFEKQGDASADSLDLEKVKDVSDRVWRIVLSDYQVENLSMSREYRAIVIKHEVETGQK